MEVRKLELAVEGSHEHFDESRLYNDQLKNESHTMKMKLDGGASDGMRGMPGSVYDISGQNKQILADTDELKRQVNHNIRGMTQGFDQDLMDPHSMGAQFMQTYEETSRAIIEINNEGSKL